MPDNPKSHFELAVIYARQGKYVRAIEGYRFAIALDPDNAEYRRHLGAAYQELGRLAEARKELDEARRLEAQHVEPTR